MVRKGTCNAIGILRHRHALAHCLYLCLLFGIFGRPVIAAAATTVVTDEDAGGSVHLKAGDTLEVRVKSSPSTGYTWSILANQSSLLKLKDKSQTEPNDPAGVGRPILQIFRFEAESHGDEILLLHYVRSWEKPAPGEKQFKIHVSIR